MAVINACPYSKSAIVDARKALSEDIAYDPGTIGDTAEAFRVAHSWRLSAVYPMRRIRSELAGKVRATKTGAITAARLKRMVSIRKKLRNSPLNLYQMQDLAGCRAILPDQRCLDRLVARYTSGDGPNLIVRDNDHIRCPKSDTGYRSRHLVFKFNDPDGNAKFNRHFVEVQFRTQMQHNWATAVEAVGLVRGEDLKGASGHQDWLRLFQLIAGYMAEVEDTDPVPGIVANSEERGKELRDVSARLNALQVLDSYNRAIQHIESYVGFASYYLIQYDIVHRHVRVQPFRAASAGSEQYVRDELNPALNTVLVEVDRVADLRQAYPNYFLDVEAFTGQLRLAIDPRFTTGIRAHPTPPARHLRWFEDWKSWRQRDR